MKTHTLRTLSTITVLVLCLGLQACQDKAQEPANEEGSGAAEASPSANTTSSPDEKPVVEDVIIDETYPDLVATFDGEPMKIRAAIAFVQEVTNVTGTPEGARRVHLFTQPTNCKRGMKAFINKANKAEYVRFQFQTGQAVVLSANSPGNQLRGLNTTGFDGIDFSKVDTTPGALSTITCFIPVTRRGTLK